MRLFHFSDDAKIDLFTPRPVRIPAVRPAEQAWLNGPLVWAIDEAHEHLYLFPRECPRIVVWPTPATEPAERARWFGDRPARAIAHIERRWLGRLRSATIFRYELSIPSFEDARDAGMWVSRAAVRPLAVEAMTDLPAQLEARGIELRVLKSLAPLKDVWKTSLHASGLRLRNARGWAEAAPSLAN